MTMPVHVQEKPTIMRKVRAMSMALAAQGALIGWDERDFRDKRGSGERCGLG